MKLEEALSKELYDQVKAALEAINAKEADKLKHVRFADLSEGEFISKEKYSALETDKGTLATQLQEAENLIADLKKDTKADETLQGKIGEYETTITTLTAENDKLKTESALKVALLDAGAKAEDIDYLMYKAKEKGNIGMSGDGKVKDQENLITGLKTQCPTQFAAAGANGQKKAEEHKLENGNAGSGAEDPKSLAEALKQQYGATNHTS